MLRPEADQLSPRASSYGAHSHPERPSASELLQSYIEKFEREMSEIQSVSTCSNYNAAGLLSGMNGSLAASPRVDMEPRDQHATFRRRVSEQASSVFDWRASGSDNSQSSCDGSRAELLTFRGTRRSNDATLRSDGRSHCSSSASSGALISAVIDASDQESFCCWQEPFDADSVAVDQASLLEDDVGDRIVDRRSPGEISARLMLPCPFQPPFSEASSEVCSPYVASSSSRWVDANSTWRLRERIRQAAGGYRGHILSSTEKAGIRDRLAKLQYGGCVATGISESSKPESASRRTDTRSSTDTSRKLAAAVAYANNWSAALKQSDEDRALSTVRAEVGTQRPSTHRLSYLMRNTKQYLIHEK